MSAVKIGGGGGVDRGEALAYAQRYLTDGAGWAYPAYDAYEREPIGQILKGPPRASHRCPTRCSRTCSCRRSPRIARSAPRPLSSSPCSRRRRTPPNCDSFVRKPIRALLRTA